MSIQDTWWKQIYLLQLPNFHAYEKGCEQLQGYKFSKSSFALLRNSYEGLGIDLEGTQLRM